MRVIAENIANADSTAKTAGTDPYRRKTVSFENRIADGLGLKIGDFDLIEINEAFASQGLACLRQLGIADDAEHVNHWGTSGFRKLIETRFELGFQDLA